ncbi:MAG: Mov34/MPN/PAD-1 family protein [Thermodesulfovibrionia bacterium]
MKLNKSTIEEISRHALETYPGECCGIVTGDSDRQSVHLCRNIQDRLHAEDSGKYPRDARTAYAIERSEAGKIFAEAKEQDKSVIAFYHSHVEHDAYFSDMDKEVQSVFGEPEFPEALQVVISVKVRKINDIKYFRWDKDKKDFILQE